MSLDIYYDVDQGESTPVRYQQSNSTIKAIWKCDDEESDIVVSCLRLVSQGLNNDWLRLAQDARYIYQCVLSYLQSTVNTPKFYIKQYKTS